MRFERLQDMMRGWFVGAFTPAVFSTQAVEVGIKEYGPGDYEARHWHAVATEITVIIRGTAEMNGRRLIAGDIVVVEPGEATDFTALAEVTTVVVKIPGALNDKYVGHTNA